MKTSVSKWMKTIGLTVVLLFLGTQFSACTSQAPVDQVGLYITGGFHQGHKFKKVVLPGSGSTFLGWADDVKWLPNGVRNYTVSKKAGEGDVKGFDIITVPALGGVLMDYELQVNFRLNTSCVNKNSDDTCTIRKFWTLVGNKYHADTDGGWDKMLNQVLRRQIETAILARTRQTDPGQLYANQAGSGQTEKANADVLLQLQADIGQTLTHDVNSNVGGPFFCGPSFDRRKTECPDMVFQINSIAPHDQATLGSFEAIRRSANDVLTAKNNALKAEQDAKGVQLAQQAQGEITANFIEYTKAQAMKTCAERQQGCSLVFVSGNSANVNVNSK